MTDDGEWLSFPDAPRIVVPPPGPRSRELLAEQAKLETDAVGYPHYFPIAPRIGQGSTIEDVDGNRFIDWVSGISVLNLGHRHPRVVAALDQQAKEIWHTLELPTEARIRFLRAVMDALPVGLRGHARIFLTVTGGDAVETAVNLADHAQKRHGTVAFSGAYHGMHGGASNLTSGRRYRLPNAFPGGSVVRVPYPDPFRPVLGADEGAAGTISYLEHLVSDPHSGVDSVSAVVVEPILGEGGYVVPPDDFLPSLREFCDRHDLLLIVDEIQTGLGRTGKMWAVEHVNVTPDLLCIAKSLGGGLPLSVVAYRSDLVRELPRGFHLGTFRGNALALAAGAETVKILGEGDLLDRTRHRGARVLERLRSISDRHPPLGDVRGRGFMIGAEFVRSRAGREAWGDRAKAMRAALLARGVLMHTAGAWEQVLRFMSPLVIEDELLERGLMAFEEALESLESGPVVGRTSGPLGPRSGAGELRRPPEHAVPVPGVPPLPGPVLDEGSAPHG
jgi:4-aminobutyrate aminotransferase-like enzyme